MKSAYRFAALTLRALAWIAGSAMSGLGLALMAVGEGPRRERREER